MSTAVTAVTMPKWGLTMTEGTVVGWLKQQGQRFAEGEEILEIETPKITNVVEAPSASTLRRIVAPPGATLPVGALLAVMAADEVSPPNAKRFKRAVDGIGQPFGVAGTDFLGRPAMPRQIQCDGAPCCR